MNFTVTAILSVILASAVTAAVMWGLERYYYRRLNWNSNPRASTDGLGWKMEHGRLSRMMAIAIAILGSVGTLVFVGGPVLLLVLLPEAFDLGTTFMLIFVSLNALFVLGLGIYYIAECFWGHATISDAGIDFQFPFTRRGFVPWHAIHGVSFNNSQEKLIFETQTGEKMQLSRYLTGMSFLQAFLERHVPRESWEATFQEFAPVEIRTAFGRIG